MIPEFYKHEEYRLLLANVFEMPKDDLYRLIIADWLEDRGFDDRAKFIREHIQDGHDYEVFVNCTCIGCVEKRQRFPELVPGHSACRVTFKRGFVTSIRCWSGAWVKNRHLVAQHPIDEVVIPYGSDVTVDGRYVVDIPSPTYFATDEEAGKALGAYQLTLAREVYPPCSL